MALTLFSGDPFMTSMDRMMDRMITGALGFPMSSRQQPAAGTAGTLGILPMDVVEHDQHWQLVADTPGMTPEDIKVEARPRGILGARVPTRQQSRRMCVYALRRACLVLLSRFAIPHSSLATQTWS